MANDIFSRDPNRIPVVGAVSTVDYTTTKQLTAIPFSSVNTNALTVAIVDGSGVQVTSFGGGTQYANGTAAVTPTGTVSLGYDGSNVRALKTATNGSLLVVGDASGTAVFVQAGGGASFPVTQATAASLNATVVGTGTFVVQATLAAETTKVIGVVRTADGSGNLYTTNSTTYTAKFGQDSNLLGTLGTAFSTAGKVDIKAADGDLFVRQTTSSNLNADVNLKSIAGTGIVNGGIAGSQSIGGTVATNVAITANPINLGAQAVSSENSVVTTARQVQLVADLVGKLIVLPYANPENFVSGRATATDTTSTSLIASPGGSLRNYITQITVWNSSATNTYIKIQDGSGGTELYDIPCPATGGATLTFPTPIRQPTTATAIFFAANASANAVFVSASGYKGV